MAKAAPSWARLFHAMRVRMIGMRSALTSLVVCLLLGAYVGGYFYLIEPPHKFDGPCRIIYFPADIGGPNWAEYLFWPVQQIDEQIPAGFLVVGKSAGRNRSQVAEVKVSAACRPEVPPESI
jgi:hypothetical protein